MKVKSLLAPGGRLSHNSSQVVPRPSVFESGRVKALLLAFLFLGLASGAVSWWDFERDVAHYRRPRTIRSLRVNEAESGHELSLAQHAAAHDPVVQSTIGSSAGTDNFGCGDEAAMVSSAPAAHPPLELRLQTGQPPTAPPSYPGFSGPARGPPSLS